MNDLHFYQDIAPSARNSGLNSCEISLKKIFEGISFDFYGIHKLGYRPQQIKAKVATNSDLTKAIYLGSKLSHKIDKDEADYRS
jgi:hypothetical protein